MQLVRDSSLVSCEMKSGLCDGDSDGRRRRENDRSRSPTHRDRLRAREIDCGWVGREGFCVRES